MPEHWFRSKAFPVKGLLDDDEYRGGIAQDLQGEGRFCRAERLPQIRYPSGCLLWYRLLVPWQIEEPPEKGVARERIARDLCLRRHGNVDDRLRNFTQHRHQRGLLAAARRGGLLRLRAGGNEGEHPQAMAMAPGPGPSLRLSG